MICRNCGQKIKDPSRGKCENCGYPIHGNYEGNGFFDILTKKEEPSSITNASAESMNNDVIVRLVNAQKETQRRLNTEKTFRFSLVAVCMVLVIALIATTMSFNGKIDTLNERIERLEIKTGKIDTEHDKDDNSVEKIVTGINEKLND